MAEGKAVVGELSKWFQTILIIMSMVASAVFFVARSDANQATFLKESEAYKEFATKQDLKDALESLNSNLRGINAGVETLNAKLDRHISRESR